MSSAPVKGVQVLAATSQAIGAITLGALQASSAPPVFDILAWSLVQPGQRFRPAPVRDGRRWLVAEVVARVRLQVRRP